METQSSKKAKRLTIYIGESDLWRGKALYMVLLETMRELGLAGATVTRGIAGFGARSRIHTASILRLSDDLPLVVEVIDSTEKIVAALETIYPMIREGMITLEDVQVLKYTHRDLNPLPGDRPVKVVMSSEVKSISPLSSVAQAWQLMINQHLKALPVVNESQEVVGILTDEDLINRAGLHQRISIAKDLTAQEIEAEITRLSQSKQLVKDVMNTPVITIPEEYSLNQAVTLMKKYHLKRIPVLGKKEKISGMLSRFDILRQIVPIESTQPAELSFLNTPKTVGQIMSPTIPLVNESDNLETMIEAFLRHHSHRLIVIDEDYRVTGILNDADIVNRLPYKNKTSIISALRNLTKPPETTVIASDLMSREPLQSGPEVPIPQAVQMLIKEGRKILVVVDDNKHPIGLVDRQRLLEALINIPNNLE